MPNDIFEIGCISNKDKSVENCCGVDADQQKKAVSLHSKECLLMIFVSKSNRELMVGYVRGLAVLRLTVV